jgi:hypothetical protein
MDVKEFDPLRLVVGDVKKTEKGAFASFQLDYPPKEGHEGPHFRSPVTFICPVSGHESRKESGTGDND